MNLFDKNESDKVQRSDWIKINGKDILILVSVGITK